VSSGDWLNKYLGLKLEGHQYFFNGTTGIDDDVDGSVAVKYDESGKQGGKGKYCSTRSIMDLEIGSVAWHETESAVTPTGPLAPSYWWNYAHNLHATRFPSEGSGEDFEWDGFMHAASHMYTADLTPFVELYKAEGLSHLKRRYTSVDGVPMFTLHVPMPSNGQLAVLHSAKVAAKHESLFKPLEASSCAEAVALPVATALLQLNYATMVTEGADDYDSGTGLPTLMPVMESAPSAGAAEVETYFTAGLKALGLTASLAAGGSGDDACTFVDVTAPAEGIGPNGDQEVTVTLRYVETPNSFDADKSKALHSVGDYCAYVDAQGAAFMGSNSGYTRWIDNHVAYTVPASVTLDVLAGDLEATGTAYHAHVTSDTGDGGDGGSLWTMGVGGLAIEWHGDFDYTKFSYPVGSIDFCTADSVCRSQDTMCGAASATVGVTMEERALKQ